MSGTGKGLKYLKGIENIFANIKKEGLIPKDKVCIELTKYIGHATEIVKEYIEKFTGEMVVYVVGGDGTLSEVAEAIKYVDTTSMVVIPRGTGNDFARATNSYKSMRKIIRKSLEEKPVKVDSISIKKCTCMNVLNAGLDAAIADNMNLFRKWPVISGSMKYKLAIAYTILGAKKYKLKIRVDDKIYKGVYTLIAIGNNKYYGGGVKALPYAEIDDGMLDVCLIDSTTLIQKLFFLPKFSKGKHEGIKLVKLLKGKEISVVSTRKMPVSIDGEIYYTNRFKAKVEEKSVNIIKTLDK
ncbi:MAG: YegS/Rv2252/BmrU family lipid kinase [Clostridia bacterium]|nr:YegS/Rv2252/BmrU family lipid kinase [Clostridia bacterium]